MTIENFDHPKIFDHQKKVDHPKKVDRQKFLIVRKKKFIVGDIDVLIFLNIEILNTLKCAFGILIDLYFFSQ